MEAATETANSTYKYLKQLKYLLDLPNDIEENKRNIEKSKNKNVNQEPLLSLSTVIKLNPDQKPEENKDKKDSKEIYNQRENKDKQNQIYNYVITDDNYKKMVLLIYRIQANVPVIIMGETGCGKTTLIKKLCQILNNGEKLDKIIKIINIHPGITDEDICNEMIEINKKAKERIKNGEYWAFFDEINTCLSLSLLTEIFISRTFKGQKLEDNIRIIGACNPYREKQTSTEVCGLTREDDEEDKRVYKVNQLPHSLLYYVFCFGSITLEDEKKYIFSIIENLFNINEKKEEKMHYLTTEIISKCHKFLRDTFKEPSIVSLREISRFVKCVEFFQDYFIKKINKIKRKLLIKKKNYIK